MEIYQGTRHYQNKMDLLRDMSPEKIGGKVYLDDGTTVVSLHPGEIKNRSSLTAEQWFNYARSIGRGYPSGIWRRQMKYLEKHGHFEKSKPGIQHLSPSIEMVSIGVYDEEVYFSLFPDATDEDYDRIEDIIDNPLELMHSLEKEHRAEIKAIRYVYIDEYYFAWLEKNNLQENPENRMAYITNLADENVREIWAASFNDYFVLSLFLPIMIIQQSTDSLCPKKVNIVPDSVELLKKKICRAAKQEENNICVYDAMISPEYADRYADELEDYHDHYFDSAAKTEAPDIRIPHLALANTQSPDTATVYPRLIPVGFKINTPCFYTEKSAEQLQANYESLDAPLTDGTIKQIAEILKNNIKSMDILVYENMIVSEDIPEFYQAVASAWDKALKAEGAPGTEPKQGGIEQ
jgi:hypothetical protein